MRLGSFSVLFILWRSSAALFGQTPAYHVELSDGESGWVVLTNYSQKPIEAFQVKASCGPGASETTEDFLDGPLQRKSHPIVPRGQTGVIQPGERFFTDLNLPAQPSRCTWSVRIPALVYADGSYEGSKDSVRELQARRDGLSYASEFWDQTLNEAVRQHLMGDAIAEQAKDIVDRDRAKAVYPGCHDDPVPCSYWQGRLKIDTNVASWAKTLGPAQLEERLAGWCRKIRTDEALKKLESEFPYPSQPAGHS